MHIAIEKECRVIRDFYWRGPVKKMFEKKVPLHVHVQYIEPQLHWAFVCHFLFLPLVIVLLYMVYLLSFTCILYICLIITLPRLFIPATVFSVGSDWVASWKS